MLEIADVILAGLFEASLRLVEPPDGVAVWQLSQLNVEAHNVAPVETDCA